MRWIGYLTAFILCVVTAITGCTDSAKGTSASKVPAGGIYALKSDDGTWSIHKVLVVDDENGIVQLRTYSNKLSHQPTKDIDATTLTMEKIEGGRIGRVQDLSGSDEGTKIEPAGEKIVKRDKPT
ncbi:MAG: hypothetical protein ABI579_04695 [Candidatus Sumerlaeota bacterium]